MMDPTQIDATEHYRHRAQDLTERNHLLMGLILGFVSGLLWEAIRR